MFTYLSYEKVNFSGVVYRLKENLLILFMLNYKEGKKMKYIILLCMLCGTQSLAVEELEGNDAKNLILTGEVMGAHMMEKRYLEAIGADTGTFFSVKSDENIYNCYYLFGEGYFCESLD